MKMDTLHTGSSRRLLSIYTPYVNVMIDGKPFHPLFEGIEYSEEDSTVRASCLEEFTMDINDHTEESSFSSNITFCNMKTIPLFYEQQAYQICIEAVDDCEISVFHENYHIRQAIKPLGTRENILLGTVNFDNNIGYSDFIISVNGEKYLKFTIEVFPAKISYKEDYQAMMKDISEELYALAFDFMRKTYLSYKISAHKASSAVEFFAIIKIIYQDFMKATQFIVSHPHHELNRQYEVRRADQIRHTDHKSIRWLQKHPQQLKRKNNHYVVRKGLNVEKRITYNTRENMFVKHILEMIMQKLDAFLKNYQNVFKTPDVHVVHDIAYMKKGINRLINISFLKQVDDQQGHVTSSLVFSMASGYRELYKYSLMLQKGLSLSADVFSLSVKDIARLYEYWCFIKLNSILKSRYELISQNIIKMQSNGLYITLKKGEKASEVKYRNPRTEESITLTYNPPKKNLPTVSQKPDNVLKLEKRGGRVEYSYIFDAKYKINPAIKDQYYYQVIDHHPGPQIDDINTMHRYRDAIVLQNDEHPYERIMFGAYILFPYTNEEEYKEHRFYKSIEAVNIGGLPFLPSATSLVTEMLDELILESENLAFARTTLPIGIENKLKHVNWDYRDVFVTAVSKEELSKCLKDHWITMDRDLFEKPIRHIALYQPRSIFGKEAGITYYGEVMNRFGNRIQVQKWHELKRTITPKEQFHGSFLTNYFLLKHARDIAELRIQNGNEYRLFYELRRTMDDVEVNDRDHDFMFHTDQYDLILTDQQIILKKGKHEKKIDLGQMRKSPHQVMKVIKNYVE